MKYPIVERFKAPQGEGVFTGTPMAFIRFVGCSVGQKVCTACDTKFDKMYPELGGGLFTLDELLKWADNYRHLCLTGGEPLDRDLTEFVKSGCFCHIETSGTTGLPLWVTEPNVWLTISPKPGYREENFGYASEIKVILGGLGDGLGWPTLNDALRWAQGGKLVYLQPCNSVLEIDKKAMDEAIRIVTEHPTLRLSAQLHKYLRVR